MVRVVRVLYNFIKQSYKAVPVFIVFGFWELITTCNLVSTALLPRFSSVIMRILELTWGGVLFQNISISLYRAFSGLALGILIGVVLGFGMATKKHIERFFYPIVTITFPIPKVALVPLVIVWLGVTDQAAIVIVFLGTLLPMLINAYHGVLSVDKKLLWSALSLGTRPDNIFRKVVIPASLPYILNGVKIALPTAFIVVISAEFVASRAGVGYLISGYGALGLYDYMFAVILIFIILCFLVDRIVAVLSKRLLRWYEG